MIRIRIDNKSLELEKEITILEAGEKIGIDIPTLCYMNKFKPHTSCMICVVEIKNLKKIVPACSALIEDKIVIETDNKKVRSIRRKALGLFLSEHAGDCIAPCQKACPVHLDIPGMLRLIKNDRVKQALTGILSELPFPSITGRLCHAPCEKGCRRNQYDKGLSIRDIECFAGDLNLRSADTLLLRKLKKTDKKIAVIGSGLTGLSCAYFLNSFGHDVTVIEKSDSPGGRLLDKFKANPAERIIKKEIGLLKRAGVKFRMKYFVNDKKNFKKLQQEFNCIVIATGDMSVHSISFLQKKMSVLNKYKQGVDGVFICESVLNPGEQIIYSISSGKKTAFLSHQDLTGQKLNKDKFNSILGKLKKGEMPEFLKTASKNDRLDPGKFDLAHVKKEAERCLDCDCRKKDDCLLRDLSDEYGADRKQFKGERLTFKRYVYNDHVFEPGKCIKCAKCVRLSENAGIKFGYAFMARGFDLYTGIPFNEKPGNDFKKIVKQCIKECPTGALAKNNKIY